ncbi:hypothetical protein MMC25_003613 [Agyrium rufum]|nr:hypothetical protein [Agyrium rufum]
MQHDYLTRLAPEIRNMIYSHLLLHPERLMPLNPLGRCATKRNHRSSGHAGDGIGLLSTSRLLHEEASAIFYGSNLFEVIAHTAAGTTWWLKSIGDNIKLLKYLVLDNEFMLRIYNNLISLPLTRHEVNALPMCQLSQSLGQDLQALNQAHIKKVYKTLPKYETMAGQDLVASLNLLQENPELMLLEFRIPSSYEDLLDDSYDMPCGVIPAGIRLDICKKVSETLLKLKIRTEVRCRIFEATAELGKVMNQMGVEHGVFFYNSPQNMDFGDADLFEDLCDDDFRITACGLEAREKYKPISLLPSEARIGNLCDGMHNLPTSRGKGGVCCGDSDCLIDSIFEDEDQILDKNDNIVLNGDGLGQIDAKG